MRRRSSGSVTSDQSNSLLLLLLLLDLAFLAGGGEDFLELWELSLDMLDDILPAVSGSSMVACEDVLFCKESFAGVGSGVSVVGSCCSGDEDESCSCVSESDCFLCCFLAVVVFLSTLTKALGAVLSE